MSAAATSFNVDEDINPRRGCSPTRLNKPIDLSALIKEGKAVYDLDIDPLSQENDFDQSDADFVFKDKIQKHVNFDVLDGGDDNDEDKDLSPFEKIRKRMEPLTSDGKIMKKILKEGSGEVAPPKSHVKIHYQVYTEYQEVPFDVSYLRNKKPESFKLGEGFLLPGLEFGVMTMKAGETAWFLIHHDYAYGKLGVGARIPKEATCLFEVTLVSFSENINFNPDEELTFERVVERVNAHLNKGKERLTDDGDCNLAINHYKQARNLILDFNLNNDSDDTLAKLLNRTYQNLAISHNKIKDFKTTCKLAEDAMHVIPQLADKNVKLKFHWGKALSALNEYDAALKRLKEAKQLEPANRETSKELLALEQKIKKYDATTRIAAQKFFNTEKPEEEKEFSATDSFVKSMTEQLELFKLTETCKSLTLSPGMTADERKAVKSIASKVGLLYAEYKDIGGEKIFIRKK